MTSGYVEAELEKFFLNIKRIVQAELNRSFRAIQIIEDYYDILQAKNLEEIPEYYNEDLLLKETTLVSLIFD